MPRRRDAHQSDHVVEKQLGGKRRVALRVIDESKAGTFEPRAGVPATRGDCVGGVRPCPFVRCTHHTWLLEGRDRAGRRGHGQLPPTTIEPRWLAPNPGDSCALDVADRISEQRKTSRSAGEFVLSIAAIGIALGRDEGTIWLVLKRALAKLRAGGVELEHMREMAKREPHTRLMASGCRRIGPGAG